MPLLLVVFAPAIAALLVGLLPRNRLSRWVIGVPALLFVFLVGQLSATEPLSVDIPWATSLGVTLALQLDGLALAFALVVTGIGTLVLLYAGSYFGDDRAYVRFSGITLLFMAAMLGIVLSRNLLLIFVFWEITSITSYLLIGFNNESVEARNGARQALLVTAAGGLALLAGIILIGQVAGTYNIDQLLATPNVLRDSSLYAPILLLVLAGAFTKSAQWPFHFWLPGAMAAPTPASTYLHSATMVKAGVFLLARLSPLLSGTDLWLGLLGGFGLFTFVYAGLFALKQTDLKAILAYSTVSWLGALVAVQAPGTQLGAIALIVGVLAHALYKGALFLVAGSIDHETGTRDIRLLGALARPMPLTFAGALIAAASMAGIPPLMGFLSKETFLVTALDEALRAPWNTIFPAAVVIGSILTVTIAIRVLWDTFIANRQGELPKHPHEAPWPMWIGPLVLGATAILLPLALTLVLDSLVSTGTSSILGQPTEVHLHLFEGINTPLILSTIAIAAGLLLFAFRRPLLRGMAGLPEGNPSAIFRWSVETALPGVAEGLTRRLQNGRLRVYLLTVMGFLLVMVISAIALAQVDIIDEAVLAGFDPLAAFICVLIMIGAIVGTIVPTRLSTVVILGIEGALIALLFAIFGAPDLAFTQLMIEVITLSLFVLAFHFLPDTFRYRRPNLRRAIDVLFAVALGVMITLLPLVTIANRVAPSTSSWYIENSVPEGQGHNVVNVILVDFRGMDTQGEIIVLTIAGMGVVALLRLRPSAQPRGRHIPTGSETPVHDPDGESERSSSSTTEEQLAEQT